MSHRLVSLCILQTKDKRQKGGKGFHNYFIKKREDLYVMEKNSIHVPK